MIRTVKGPWGFNDDRLRNAAAIGQHWCLVCGAYSLLHVTGLPPVQDRPMGLSHTIGNACRHQGRALRQPLLVFV